MAEKAVDETPALRGMNVFNAVTRKIHPSPAQQPTDGGSVFASVSPRENRGQTPGGQQAATVRGNRRTQA